LKSGNEVHKHKHEIKHW